MKELNWNIQSQLKSSKLFHALILQLNRIRRKIIGDLVRFDVSITNYLVWSVDFSQWLPIWHADLQHLEKRLKCRKFLNIFTRELNKTWYLWIKMLRKSPSLNRIRFTFLNCFQILNDSMKWRFQVRKIIRLFWRVSNSFISIIRCYKKLSRKNNWAGIIFKFYFSLLLRILTFWVKIC